MRSPPAGFCSCSSSSTLRTKKVGLSELWGNQKKMASPSSSLTTTTVDALSHLLADIGNSTDHIVSLSNSSNSPLLSQFASLVDKLPSAIDSLDSTDDDLIEAVDSLAIKLKRVCISIRPSSPARLLEDAARELGRALSLLAMAWEEAPPHSRERIGAMHRDMMKVKFYEVEGVEIGRVSVEVEEEVWDLEDVVVKLKTGEEEKELMRALRELEVMIRDGVVGEESGSVVISVLLNRLGSIDEGGRVEILLLLKMLAAVSVENKGLMADVEALSTIVRSLTRDINESREAIGLLLDLSEIPRVRQRIGRIQGCIVMLVILFNGDDPRASDDSGKLLHALSSITQNVLLMSEAGYFVPMIYHLKEGSDMTKILMATSLSRMGLSEQMKTTLGEGGAIEPLVDMFITGKLEAKMSSLCALKSLSTLPENTKILIKGGIVAPLLQLLFSVTSVFVTLREPAAATLASIAKSVLILNFKDLALQILSVINLCKPVIQCHLLHALSSIAGHPTASRIRSKMKKKGVLQLILPFLVENDNNIREASLSLLYTLSEDLAGDLSKRLGETHLTVLMDMLSTSVLEHEKATAAGILCNLPADDKRITDILVKLNLLPVLISKLSLCFVASPTATNKLLLENIAGVLIRFTVPWDKNLQRASVDLGVIPLLVKVLSTASPIAQSRAATSLTQLSQNSLSLGKHTHSRWMCVPSSSSEALCEVHGCKCTVRGTFCLVKACSIPPLVQVLKGKEREADEAVLLALSTLMQDDMWVSGSNIIDKASGIEAIIGVLEVGSLNAQEKALWLLERIFRTENHKEKHGRSALVVLMTLAQKGHPALKSMVAKIMAHLQFLQVQSRYF